MDCRPTLSVITSAYNSAAFIERSLKSAAALPIDHEHIVVDAASDDDTREIIRQRNYPQVKLIPLTKRVSPAKARNIALETAKGEYIVNLDSDDEFVTSGIETKLSALQSSSNYGLAFGEARYVTQDGTKTGISSALEMYLREQLSRVDTAIYFARKFDNLKKRHPEVRYISDNQPLYRRNITEFVRYRDVRGEDLTLIIEMILKGVKPVLVDELSCLRHFNLHGIQQSGNYNEFYSDRTFHWSVVLFDLFRSIFFPRGGGIQSEGRKYVELASKQRELKQSVLNLIPTKGQLSVDEVYKLIIKKNYIKVHGFRNILTELVIDGYVKPVVVEHSKHTHKYELFPTISPGCIVRKEECELTVNGVELERLGMKKGYHGIEAELLRLIEFGEYSLDQLSIELPWSDKYERALSTLVDTGVVQL